MPTEGELFKVVIVVPGAPRGKGRPRTAVIAGRAQIYTDAKTRSEEGAVRTFAVAAMAEAGESFPYEGAVILRMCAYRQMPRAFSAKKREAAERGEIVPVSRPDVDNVTKLAADAINGIVLRDDAQIVTAIVHKRYSDQPRLVIIVKSFGTGADGTR
jgi:Holliday junction resolvase RusA-like endonuclease